MRFARALLGSAALLGILGACPPGLAQNDQQQQPAAESSAGAVTESGVTSGSTLKGGVRGAALLAQDGLAKMGQASKDIQLATMAVINEVSRKDTVTVRGPNVLPNGVVIPAFPNPSGTIQFGELDPRPKKLDRFMQQTNYSVQLLQNEVDALILPEHGSAALSTSWSEIKAIMEQVQTHLSNLRNLTSGPKYNNQQIAREALAVYDRAVSVNKLRKEILKSLPAP